MYILHMSSLIVSVLSGVSIVASPADVLAQRQLAFSTICSGQIEAGVEQLVESVRWAVALPTADTSCVDQTYCSVQLYLFAMEYLLDEKRATGLIATALHPDTSEIDRFLVTAYNVTIGLETDDKNAAARELQILCMSKKPFVCASAHFLFSDPYYFGKMGRCSDQAREELATLYPSLAITHESFLLPVYENSRGSLADIRNTFTDINTTDEIRSISTEDPVPIALNACLLAAKIQDTRSFIQALTTSCETTPDWRVRYGCLQMIESYKDKGFKSEVKGLCLRVSAWDEITPDVTRAGIILGKIARTEYNVADAKKWARIILSQQRTCECFERNLYEDVMKDVDACGRAFANHGAPNDAIEIWTDLAAKFPSSIVAARCIDRISQLRKNPTPTQKFWQALAELGRKVNNL